MPTREDKNCPLGKWIQAPGEGVGERAKEIFKKREEVELTGKGT